ncbi:MAG: hypothetical protein K2O80_00225 [Helicobacter apodemus]|nr:hypothetical protein [Helicobacter apodemus]
MLKTTAAKIKAAKKNISVQFMGDEEYQVLFNEFLEKLKNGKIQFYFNKNYKLRLMLENPSFKNILEARLKEAAADSFDYTLNREIVEIDLGIFLAMLEKELQLNTTLSAELRDYLKDIIQTIKKEKFVHNLIDITGAIMKLP